MSQKNSYIPALRYKALTPFYDSLMRVMREEEFKRRLIEQAKIKKGQRVLDLGCGTATLTMMIKQAHPEAEVIGVDGDPEVLAIGREKAAGAGVGITLDYGMAFQLPYPDESFDRVVSSLVIHHLASDDKRRAFKEVLRVLKSKGEFYILDFGKPHTLMANLIALVAQRLEQTADNIKGLLPAMLREAGFVEVEVVENFMNVVGTLSIFRGRKE